MIFHDSRCKKIVLRAKKRAGYLLTGSESKKTLYYDLFLGTMTTLSAFPRLTVVQTVRAPCVSNKNKMTQAKEQ